MSKREIIHTDGAPAAIGTYSQAVKVDNTVWISGQIPLDPVSMTLVEGDITAQTQRVFDNLAAIVAAAGGDFSRLVKLNISLTDLGHFAAVNDVMAAYIAEPYPARACVGVASLPRDALVEIEAIMVL